MATVYLAQDKKHERQVAIKVLRPDLASLVGAERFLREIHIEARLQHPNILPLHDSGEAAGLLYYVMPYVEGESLRDRLERETQLPVEDALHINREVADALNYAHSQGIVHRDVKPENILLAGGHAVLADFGIARAISEAGGDRVTETGHAVGTPAYMSPEQASGDAELDGRSDIYSLGCVLYEMLAGEPPFTGRSAQAVILKHIGEHPPSLDVVRPSVPANVARAIERAIAKVPADRFATSSEFVATLEQAVEPVVRGRRDRSRSGLRRLVPKARWRLVVFALGMAASLAAVFFVGRALYLRVQSGGQPAIDASGVFDPARIAVLYFDDHSEDQRLAPLCAAFTQKLIHELSQVEVIEVISYNGSKRYRGSNVTPDSVARAFEVGTLVEGSVSQSAGLLRVSVQLTDAATATLLGSKELERPRGELFALQDDLANEVSQFLRERLGTEIRLKQRMAETESVEAYTLVHRADEVREGYRQLMKSGDTEGAALVLQQADRLLARAEQFDPKWVEPIVLRGWIAWQMGGLLSEVPGEYQEEWVSEGLGHAKRALDLKAQDARALELRGTLRYSLYRQTSESPAAADLLESAEEDLRAAVAADPSRASAWSTFSTMLHWQGEYAEAKQAAMRAYEEDQFLEDAADILLRLSNTSLELEQYEEAIHWAELGRRRFPDVVDFPAAGLVILMSPDGPDPDVEKAWELFDQINRLMPPQRRAFFVPGAKVQVAAVLARAGDTDSAKALIQVARAGASDEVIAWLGYDEAYAWLLLGQRDRALQALTLFLESNPQDKAYIAADPWFQSLRDDPRFKALVGIDG